MKTGISPVILVLMVIALVCLLVVLPRQSCPVCGRPIYFLVLKFCGCG